MSIRQRLYPAPDQAAGMVEHCQHARFMYNIGLEQRAMHVKAKHARGTHPEYGNLDAAKVNTATQMRELTQLRAELDWLRAGSSSVQQGALRDLERAFVNFWDHGEDYPVFKKKNLRAGSFVIRDLSVVRLNRKWGEVTVPKLGRVRFRVSRTWAEITTATSARVTLRNNRWHISFTGVPDKAAPAGTGAIVGIDRGVANTVATSDGIMLQAPTWTAGEQTRFLALEQRLARQTTAAKKAGRRFSECRNRTKTLDQLANLRRRLDDRRTDWVEKTTTDLSRIYDLIAIEDLRITNMVRSPAPKPDPEQPGVFLPNGARAKAKLNKAILASCWGMFATRLTHKMAEDHVVKINPRNTSRTCAACGHCAPGNRESQAVFECVACGHQAHADTNAAINILARGLDKTAASAQNPRTFGRSPATPAPEHPVTAPQEPDTGAILSNQKQLV